MRYGLAGLYLTLLPNWQASGVGHGARLAAALDGRARLRNAVGAAAGQQVRRPLSTGQHGLVLGAGEGAHAAPGHFRGRVPGLSGSAGRACAPRAWRSGSRPRWSASSRAGGWRRWRLRSAAKTWPSIDAWSRPRRRCWRGWPRVCPPTTSASCSRCSSMGAVVLVLALSTVCRSRASTGTTCPSRPASPSWRWSSTPTSCRPSTSAATTSSTAATTSTPDHEYFALTQGELLERFLPGLARINPASRPDWVRQSWLFRTRLRPAGAAAAITRGHIPDLRTPLPGLWFASMSQVYPWDRGTNFAVEIGRRAVRRMLSEPAA